MNVMSTVTYIYGLASILLLLSFVIFQASIRVTRYFKVALTPSQLLRIAQVMVLAALVAAPVVTHLGPSFLSRWVSSSVVYPSRDASSLVGLDRAVDSAQELREKAMPVAEARKSIGDRPTPSLFWRREFFLLVFSFGMLTAGLRLLRKIRSLHSLLSSCTVLRRIQKVDILVSDEIGIPFSTRAFWRAQVVVPLPLLESRNTLRVAIQHELQHHRNGDTLWIILMEILGVVFYWNPAFYLWRHRLEELLEFACDESLITKGGLSVRNYGICLVEVAEHYINNAKPLFGTVGMAIGYADSNQGKSLLSRRIKMIFNYKMEKRNLKSALFTGGVTLGSLLALASIMGGKSEASPELKMAEMKIGFDPKVQKIANEALIQQVKSSKARDGYAVVTDPQGGRILAISYIEGDSGKALDARKAAGLVLSRVSQPNSLIKPITVAYALEHGKIAVDEKFNCENGLYKIGDGLTTIIPRSRLFLRVKW